MNGTSDEEQLKFAARVGRTLVTHNRHDFRLLHRDWGLRGDMHCGIVLVSVMPPAQVVAGLMELNKAMPSGNFLETITRPRT